MYKRVIYCLLVISISVFIFGCTTEKNNSVVKQYSEIIVASSRESYVDICNLEKNKLTKVDSINNLSDVVYNYKNSVYAYLVNVEQGQNFNQNKIVIETKEKSIVVNNFFNALDLKISPNGKKIAYRSFLKDSYDSAVGLTIYDIEKKENLKFKSSILVSGNLYNWINDDEIVYYGIAPESKEYNKLYRYNFKTNREEPYLVNINDFCTYFTLVNNKGALCLEESGSETRLVFNGIASEDRVEISKNISNIYYGTYDEKNHCIYFIGLDKNEEKCALFMVSIKDFILTRLTFDFPKEVDKNGGLAIDSSDNVYFCGGNSNGNSQLYMLLNKDKSINLVNSQSGRCYFGGNNK